MGGNAFKKVVAKRMGRERYEQIKNEILVLLASYYSKVAVPFEKPDKYDHGDLDVICLLEEDRAPFDPVAVLSSKECIVNGKVTSFEYKDHQVDMIFVHSEDEFDYAKLFLSYGDVGMILGMLSKSNGLLMGHDRFRILTPEPCAGEKLFLTSNVWKTLEFLGLEKATWLKGFTKLTEIFDWITTSRFFRPGIFCRDSMNKERRYRDRDRPMFNEFVTYCAVKEFSDEVKQREKPNQEVVFAEAVKFFEREKKWEKMLKRGRMHLEVKRKFNGNLVAEWTGLNGRELGAVMVLLRENYPQEHLVNLSEEEIKSVVMRLAIHQICKSPLIEESERDVENYMT